MTQLPFGDKLYVYFSAFLFLYRFCIICNFTYGARFLSLNEILGIRQLHEH